MKPFAYMLLGALLVAAGAGAQQILVPERPPNDNSNAAASTSYVDRAVGGVAGGITALTGDVAATGPGSATATIQSGVVTSAKMASGAAAANVGTLGGSLSGTLPNPSIGAAAVANSMLAAMAANTVKCNNTGGSATPTDCTATSTLNVLKSAPWPDTSEVVASGAAKWNPLFFGSAGTGIVHRFNRVFVGEATASSSDFGPVTTKDWSETLLANTVGVAEFAAVDTLGQLAIYGASRASDFRTVFGSSTGGAEGITGLGYNDDTTGGAIAVGAVGIGVAAAGVPGITLGGQLDMNSARTTVDVTPFGGISGGTTISNLLTSGAYSTLGTTNISAAWVAALGRTGGSKFRKGGVCQDGALDSSVGAGGDGVCIEMARNQTVRWINSGGGTDAEITANASGVQFPTDQAWTAFTPSFSCGTATITNNSARRKTLGKTTYIELDFTITAIGTCTVQVSVNLPNTGNSSALMSGVEVANTGVLVGCRLTGGGGTTLGCIKNLNAVFVVNDRVFASGVYENQ